MAKKPTPASKSAASVPPARTQVKPAYTLHRAILLCPTATLAAALERTFAVDGVDYNAIRETTEEMIGNHAKSLAPIDERAIEIHLQRIVGSFVGSACSAGEFYSTKVSDAKDLTARLANDARDEDREPIYGLESKAERAREFAAKAGMQAYAFLAAAQGAVDAFAAVTGSDWKSYQPSQPANQGVARKAASEELSAFDAR